MSDEDERKRDKKVQMKRMNVEDGERMRIGIGNGHVLGEGIEGVLVELGRVRGTPAVVYLSLERVRMAHAISNKTGPSSSRNRSGSRFVSDRNTA